MLERAVGRVIRSTRGVAPHSNTAVRAARRAAFIARVKATAAWRGATIDLQVAPDVWIGKDVRVTLLPWTHNALSVGPGSQLGDRVLIQLKGGAVVLGERVDVRRDVVLNVAGCFSLNGDNVLSWGSVVHCSTSVTVDRQTIIGEYTTIADSSHFFTGPDDHVWHNVRRGQVSVGRNCWICAKVTLGRGAHVGDHCIVGGNSVVTGSVPAGSLAVGAPATSRPLTLPWASRT